MAPGEILDFLHRTPGVFLTNNERDVSQSDFKCRIMPQTTLKVAPYRDAAGYFAFEILGGATLHIDLMKKQINPFEKLRLVRKAMPNTLIQALCRGKNLFGYRPYPDNVIEMTVRLFSRYVDIWRMYDFMNYIPNMVVAAEAVKKAGKLLMPCICFSTGPEHTDDFYVRKVEEVLSLLGEDIILCIKNHSSLGSPPRIADLVRSIRKRVSEPADRLPRPQYRRKRTRSDYGRSTGRGQDRRGCRSRLWRHKQPGPCAQPHSEPSCLRIQDPRPEHRDRFWTPPIPCGARYVFMKNSQMPFAASTRRSKRHMLPGGAISLALEQAEKAGLLERTHEVFSELIEVRKEMGNIWMAPPGSQILWSTALSNLLNGRYEKPSDDLKRLVLGRYGPFPFMVLMSGSFRKCWKAAERSQRGGTAYSPMRVVHKGPWTRT